MQPTAATLEKELEAPLTSRDTHGAQTLTDVLQPTSCVPQAPTTSRSLPRTCLGRETPRGFLAMATTSSRFRVFQTMPVPIPSTGSSVVSHSPAKARKSLSSQNPSRVFSSGRVLRDFVTTTTTTTTNTKTITQRPSSSSEVTIVNLQQSPSIQRTQSGSAAPTAAAAASTPTTGGSDIYVESASVSCGYQPCRFSANTIKELEVHMSKCVYRNSSTWLTCKQCCMPFRTVPELLNDLRTHQTKIYLCGLCGYETDLPHYVKKHLKETHCLQFDDTKYVQRVNPDTGRSECVYQPVVRNMRIRISPEAGGGAIIASGPSTSSSSFATNTGSLTTSGASAKNLVVADFDAVPRQSIFTNDVKCALCNYSTKVRRNLIRHLAQHKEDTVNKTNNAVQGSCAESRSSTSSSEPNPGLQKLFYPKQVPDYIPLRRRYECGIDGCGHLENDGTSYVEHLSSVHPNALGYPCPHCDDMYDTQSDFIMHLYLHGPNLYKCHYCTYVNNERYIVLGHCRADHMGVQSCVDTLREEHEVFTGNRSTEKRNIQMQGANPQKRRPNIGSDAVLENVSDVEDNCSDGLPLEQQQLSFECTVCNSFKSYSRSVMRTHLIQELDFESMTCNLCQFVAGKMTAMQKHFEVTHGGQTMDFAVSVDPKHEKVISTLLDAQEANIRKTKQTTHGNGNSSSSSSSNVEAPQVETEKRQERGAVTRYFCPSCSSTFKDAGLLKRHLETHLCRQTHKCNLCGASFSGMPHLRRHHSAKHHPHPFQEPKEEDDTKLDAFIDWVIKILPEQVVGEKRSRKHGVKVRGY